jgi:hypothetical protein
MNNYMDQGVVSIDESRHGEDGRTALMRPHAKRGILDEQEGDNLRETEDESALTRVVKILCMG